MCLQILMQVGRFVARRGLALPAREVDESYAEFIPRAYAGACVLFPWDCSCGLIIFQS